MVKLPFADRQAAGRMLAVELSRLEIGSGAVVLALARGGVPTGFAVADRLRLPLDTIVARKLGVPWQPELAMGAIAGAVRILDRRTIGALRITDEEVEETTRLELAEMKRREDRYRRGRPALNLNGGTAILVDDGLATGSTMLAAVRHARALQAKRVIVAVPVGSKDACERLRQEAEQLVCLAEPEPFRAVGDWYADFEQVTDKEVEDLLAANHRQVP